MPAQWTADIIGEMHLNGITKKQLAQHVGITPEYVSMVLNGHREPEGVESRFRAAVSELISEQRDASAKGNKRKPANKKSSPKQGLDSRKFCR